MPSLAFLFWNLNRKPLENRVARMVMAHAVDVVILAECSSDPSNVASTLSTTGDRAFQLVSGSGDWLHLYARSAQSAWRLLYADPLEGWLAFRMAIPRLPKLLVIVAHLPSKLRASEGDQRLAAASMAKDIEILEDEQGHRRTVLVGDLNMNPFEEGVAGAGHVHGVMTRQVAAREVRKVRGNEYRMFYNPMWGLFGDRTPGPPGTYYRSSTGAVNYFWNTYDQVLVRPDLTDRLVEVRVLDNDGVDTLSTRGGLPDTGAGSDHLPLFFRFDW